MSNASIPTYMELQWFLPIFVAGWFTISGLLAHLGGWASLAQRFRANEVPSGDRFRFLSGSMGNRYLPVNYGGCLFATVNRTGPHLSIFFLLRFQSPPLFIPWNEVESVTEKRLLFIRYTVIQIRKHWARISLRGRVAQCVREAY